MASVQNVIDKIYTFLPKKYHKDIQMCSSYTGMLKVLIKDGWAKTLQEAKDYFKEDYEISTEIEQEFNNLAHSNNQSGCTLGLTYEHSRHKNRPILLNKVLSKESERRIALTILHEIGHISLKGDVYHSEKYADKFAVKWVKRLIENNIIK